MKIYVEDFLIQNPSKERVTGAFHFFDPEIPGIGRVYGLVTISGTGEFDPLNVARFVWNGVQDSFRETEEEDKVVELKSALEAAKRKLSELIKHDNSLEDGVGLDIGLIRYIGNVIYFGSIGDTKVFVFHEGSVINVSALLEENNVNAGSTEVSGGDIPGLFITDEKEVSFDVKTPESLLADLKDRSSNEKMDSIVTSLSVDLREVVEIISKDIEIEDTSEISEPIVEENLEPPAEESKDEEIKEEIEKEADTIPTEEPPYEEEKKKEEDPIDAEEALIEEGAEGSVVIDHVEETEVEKITDENLEDSEEEISETVIEEEIKTEEILLDEDALHSNRESKKEGGEKFQEVKDKTIEVVGKGADAIGGLFRNIGSWANRFLLNKYGRKAWFKRLKARFSQTRFSSHRTPDIRVGDYKEKSQRNKRLTVALVLIVVIGAGYFGYKSAKTLRDERAVHADFNNFYLEVSDLIEAARTNISVDKEQAKISLSRAENLVTDKEYTAEYLSEEDWLMYEKLQGDVQGVSDDLTRTVRLTEGDGNITEFADLKILLGENTDPTDVAIFADSFSSENLVVTDDGSDKVFIIPIVDKEKYKTIPDPDNLISKPLFVDIGNTGIFVYDDVTGVVKAPFVDESKREVEGFTTLSGVSKSDFGDVTVSEMAILTLEDNVYALDGTSNSVYKSVGGGSGYYGLPYEFFSIDGDSQSSTDFFAGLSLYVTSSTGEGVKRFVAPQDGIGGPSEYSVSFVGLQEDLKDITAGFTGGSLNDPLVVFDSARKSFIVFEKPDEVNGRHPNEMLLLAQYAYRGEKSGIFSNVQDFVIDILGRRIYAVDGVKIWEIDVSQ